MTTLSTLQLAVFLVGTFLGSFVGGLAGFAFGLVAAAIWLYVLTPAQAAPLIIAFGLVIQGYAVWKLRHAVKLRRLAPFVVGGLIGLPLGVEVLRWADPARIRDGIGLLLILYSLHGLLRPNLPPVRHRGWPADGAIGAVNGFVAGATGLSAIVVTVWCGLRGWTRDEQRSVFQPVAVAMFIAAGLYFGGTGFVTRETLWLALLGLPLVLAGMWGGMKLYGRLNEAQFRRIVLILLLISGVGLVLR